MFFGSTNIVRFNIHHFIVLLVILGTKKIFSPKQLADAQKFFNLSSGYQRC